MGDGCMPDTVACLGDLAGSCLAALGEGVGVFPAITVATPDNGSIPTQQHSCMLAYHSALPETLVRICISWTRQSTRPGPAISMMELLASTQQPEAFCHCPESAKDWTFCLWKTSFMDMTMISARRKSALTPSPPPPPPPHTHIFCNQALKTAISKRQLVGSVRDCNWWDVQRRVLPGVLCSSDTASGVEALLVMLASAASLASAAQGDAAPGPGAA